MRYGIVAREDPVEENDPDFDFDVTRRRRATRR